MRRTFLLLFLSLAASGCRADKPESEQKPAAAPAPPTIQPGPVWALDRPLVYELNLSTLSDQGQSPMPLFLHLKAELELTVRQSGSGRLAFVRLLHPALLDHAQRPLRGAEQLLDELSAPFGLEFSGSDLVAYYEPAGVTAQTAGYRRQLAALFQLPSSSGGNVGEWDATGLARVAYEKKDAAGVFSWKKTDYERVVLALTRRDDTISTERLRPNIKEGRGTLRLDAVGLVELERHEAIELPLTDGRQLRTEVDVRLKRQRQGELTRASAEELGLFEPAHRVAVGVPVKIGEQNWDEVMVGGRTFLQVIEGLEKLAKDSHTDGEKVEERAALFRALVGLFRLQAQTVDLAAQLVRKNSALSETLVDALGIASTNASLKTLGELALDEKVPEKLRLRSGTAFVRAPKPTPLALDLCEKMMQKPALREHGLLGTGTFTRLLRASGDVQTAERGVATLRRALEQAKRSGDRVVVLLAISNSAESAFYEAVLPYQDDPDARVREAAIQAIRLMPDARVEPRLASLLERKDTADVKAALQAFGRREVENRANVSTVLSLAAKHEQGPVRREAVLTLVKWRERWPEVEGTIRDRHDHDPDERVRQAAYVKTL